MNENLGTYVNLENTSFWEYFQKTSDIMMWLQIFFILAHFSENSSSKEDLNGQKIQVCSMLVQFSWPSEEDGNSKRMSYAPRERTLHRQNKKCLPQVSLIFKTRY